MKSDPIDINYPQAFALADILANFHDWNITNPNDEAISIMQSSFEDLDSGFILAVVNSYMQTKTSTRFSPEFNHLQFVLEKMKKHNIT